MDGKNWKEQFAQIKLDTRTLWSIIIVLVGIAIGSLFVDLGQLMTGSGFSGKAIQSHEVLVTGGKTWVAYTEPKVTLRIISDATCAECDPSDALLWLRRIVPTIEAQRVDIQSEEGKALAEALNLVTLPAFVFEKTVQDTEFYLQAEPLFRADERGDQFVFDMNKIGLPIGRYLVAPETGEGDIVIGQTEAPVTLLVFSDFQCEYCKEYHASYKQILAEYGDKVRLVWKHLPLSIHREAPFAAEAAQCAADQGKFLPYADVLFDRQSEWGKLGGEGRLKDYAWRVKDMDAAALATCINARTHEAKVVADLTLASDFNIESAPATFINREFISGAIPYADLKVLIDEALEQ